LHCGGNNDAVRRRFAVPVFAVLIYAAAMTAYVYGFEDRPDADYARETGADEILVFAGVAAPHVA
jgi:hypothetical protein